MKLTGNQESVLVALVWWGPNWVRPLDLGGRNGSHHSSTLAALERKGLVESRQRMPHASRGSKIYRLTAQGLPVAKEVEDQMHSRVLDHLAKVCP